MTRKLKYNTPRLHMGEVDIVLSNEIKLLGVVMDRELLVSFSAHVATVCKRVVAFYHQLARAAKASWGLHSETLQNLTALLRLAVDERDFLRGTLLQNKRISLFWIKAHAGLEGNELSNQLVKEAAQKLKRKFDYDSCPVSFDKRSIRTRSLDEWNDEYRAGETAGVTKKSFPDPVVAYQTIGKIEVNRFVTQVQTFQCKESPSYVCDPGESKSIFHLLLDSPVHL
ncbi:unnamed protein product [Euphydryas editha]|uniref:RNase H type-1 domain-containing protein n=1 Tax=Euphydryas editha TaxID=104508 RepID=A0AAU9VBJ3_EUPED|nr:unnamed protein product [Euphydryas editha]